VRFNLTAPPGLPLRHGAFAESASRVVVTTTPTGGLGAAPGRPGGVAAQELGPTGGDRLSVAGVFDVGSLRRPGPGADAIPDALGQGEGEIRPSGRV